MKQIHLFDKNKTFRSIKKQFDTLIKDKQAMTILKFSFFLLGVTWILFAVFYRFLPPKVPVYFSKPWGNDQLLEKQYLIFLPISVSLAFIINSRMASIGIVKDKLLAFIYLLTQLVISLLTLIFITRIILLLA
jgi:uncharacterized membrane protein